jgi:hypothetical protein
MIKFPFLIILFLLFNSMHAQGQKFPIDYSETDGELSSRDLYKSDFGRYKGFEIELYENETINIVVYSKNFQPAVALIDPKGNVYKQNRGSGKGYSSILTSVPYSGGWVIYIIGDKNAVGNYQLQTAIAEPNSLRLDSNADFCTTIEFLIAHSTAYFYLLDNSKNDQKRTVKIQGSLESFFDAEDGSYNALVYTGNDSTLAESSFSKFSAKINDCIDKTWSAGKVSGWKRTDGLSEKSSIWKEADGDKPRYVKVSVYDLQDFSKKQKNRFEIYIQINRER